MSAALSTASLNAIRPMAESGARLENNGSATSGDAAGRFAAMLAGLSGGGQGAAPANPGASLFANDGAKSEHRVSLAAVSLLVAGEELGATETEVAELSPRRRREGPADVSGQVVETAIAAGTHSDGRWMATLMAASGPALADTMA